MSEMAASGADRDGSERRFLTIEFIDLVGYTDLAERLDPEELGVLLRRYQRLAVTIMERYGGFVAQVIGDGILVYFGYPVAHENEAERALLAALALQQAMRELDTEIHGRTLAKLQVRIGVHSGLVLMAQELLISAGTTRHGVFGEAVNLAARLQSEASPGRIATSQETVELVEGLFEVKSLGLKSIKGLSRQVEVYDVLRTLPGTKRTESRLRRGAGRLVGRETAMERITALWNTVKEKSVCRTVAVQADAGVGKTRLVLELTARPEFLQAPIFQAQCNEIFASTPLYPLALYLWGRVGLTADDDDAARRRKIAGYLGEIRADTEENREVVASLLGMASPASGPAAAAPQLLRRKQYDFVVSIVKHAAAMRPVMLWVEDVHWIDPSSAELLNDIALACAKLPLLMLLTVRPSRQGAALPEIHETVRLEHLDARDCFELARSVQGADGLGEESLSKAVDAAGGVPLFLEQLVISLIDERSRHRAPPRTVGGVPLMLAELMSERLDRRPGARRIAQAAACIGRSFTVEFLAALLKDDSPRVHEGLQSLVEAEILLPRRYGAEIRYEFCHALLQRLAQESIVQSERRAIHGRIVEALRAAQTGEPVLPEVLAYHLTEAGAYADAIGAWLTAGVSAARRSAHVEAVEHIRKGLALLDKVQDPAVRTQFELKLQACMMGSLLATLSASSPELAACCERGLQLCEQANVPAMVFPFAFGHFTFTNCRGRGEEAIELARLFLSRAERGGLPSERVIGHRMLGQALLAQGEAAAAKEELERSLSLYVHERDEATTHMYGQNTEVHTKSLLSLTHWCLGELDSAIRTGVDALRTGDALRHPHSTGIPMIYVGGWMFGLAGAVEPMMAEAKNLLALAEQHRLNGYRAHAAAFIGWGLSSAGKPDQGIPMIARAIGGFDSVEFRLAVAGHLANLADAQRRVGRIPEALAAAQRAMDLMPLGSRWLEPELRRVQAVVSAAAAPRETARAESLFRAAIQRAQELRFPAFERSCLASFQEFLRSAGREDRDVEARLREVSHLANAGRRVAEAMQARSA
jgi:class 3 adenylate cyclase/tetratricopeptide (TPR) repeat protein